MNDELTKSIAPLEELTQKLIDYAPMLALFVLVVIGGLILSWIARGLTRWLVRKSGLEVLGEKAGVAKLLYAVGIRRGLAHVLATVVWVAGLLLTFSAAAELIGLTAVASGVATIMGFLPRLLAAAMVLLAGISLATLMRSLIERVGKRRENLESPDFVAKAIYYVIVTVSVVMAADQAGLETDLVHQLLVVAVALGLASVGLAFAMGSRTAFRNLVAAHYFRRAVHPGDEVRVGEHSGVLVRFAGVIAVIRTDDGEVLVPCQTLLDAPIGVRVVTSDQPPPAPQPTDNA